jgi:hypothetical protein
LTSFTIPNTVDAVSAAGRSLRPNIAGAQSAGSALRSCHVVRPLSPAVRVPRTDFPADESSSLKFKGSGHEGGVRHTVVVDAGSAGSPESVPGRSVGSG